MGLECYTAQQKDKMARRLIEYQDRFVDIDYALYTPLSALNCMVFNETKEPEVWMALAVELFNQEK